MKLIGLHLTNFKSFVDCDLDLNLDGLVAIVGENGAGKSTLFAAIEWALYGSRRGRGSVPLRHDGSEDAQPCGVELDFEIAGRSYNVQRELHGEAQLVDRETGDCLTTGQDAVSRAVAATLGMDRSVFCGTFYARQGEVQALDNRPDRARQRREHLEQLLGIDRLRGAADLARSDAEAQGLIVETTSRDCPDVDELKKELAKRREEAQAAAPAVIEAEKALSTAKAGKKKARKALDAAHKREREIAKRGAAAQEASKALGEAQLHRDHLQQQLNETTSAEQRMTELGPTAGRVEELAAREREQDLRRQAHKRAESLRERQRGALATAAAAADKLSALDDGEAVPVDQIVEQAEAAEERVHIVIGELAEQGTQKAAADAEVTRLEAQRVRARRAVELEGEIHAAAESQRLLDEATTAWHRLQAEQQQLGERLAEAQTLRAAVLEQGPEAACPRCKRKYGDDWQSILNDYDAEIEATHKRDTELDSELATAKSLLDERRDAAAEAQQLRAERAALGEVLAEHVVAAALEKARAWLSSLAEAEEQLATERTELESSLKELRVRRRASEQQRQEHDQLARERDQAVKESELYAEELRGLNANGYDPDAHRALKDELEATREAAAELAALQKAAKKRPLLEKQVEAALEELESAEAIHQERRAAVAEIGVDDAAVERAQTTFDQADSAVELAQGNLATAQREAERDDEAVKAAKARLDEARKRHRRLKDERVELRWRQEVARALSQYREEASRNARPTLARETTLLLSQVTRGRYASASLGEDYLLQIFDQGAEHPLRRFSGGEQDLANLCLRLALSRTLARQRGTETGFVLLDEVFGSQDAERRESLLEQLRELGREFRQIFVVSHLEDIKEHCDRHIFVERRDGVSQARQG